MADVIKVTSVLQNVFEFADGDTRTVTLDNPADSIKAGDSVAAAAVQSWADYAKTNNLIIGDKSGAALSGIISSKVIEGTSTSLDLTTD